MPYKPDKQQSVIVSKYHHKLLQELKRLNRTTIIAEAELAIEKRAKDAGIVELRA